MRRLDSIRVEDFSLDDGNDEVEEVLGSTSAAASSKGNEAPRKKRLREESTGAGADTSSAAGKRTAMPLEEVRRAPNVGYYLYSTRNKDGREVQEVWLQCGLGVVSHREGVHACDPTPAGKPSLSMFRLLGYDPGSDTSLVECRPYTGRTHQLRLHLQLLGNPIANDPCYGGELFYGDKVRKEQAIYAMREMKRLGVTPLARVPHFDAQTADISAPPGNESKEEQCRDPEEVIGDNDERLKQREDETDGAYLERTCKYCQEHASIKDLGHLLHCDGIWLHAWKYSGKSWSFQAPSPSWSAGFPTDNASIYD